MLKFSTELLFLLEFVKSSISLIVQLRIDRTNKAYKHLRTLIACIGI